MFFCFPSPNDNLSPPSTPNISSSFLDSNDDESDNDVSTVSTLNITDSPTTCLALALTQTCIIDNYMSKLPSPRTPILRRRNVITGNSDMPNPKFASLLNNLGIHFICLALDIF